MIGEVIGSVLMIHGGSLMQQNNAGGQALLILGAAIVTIGLKYKGHKRG